jgi:hypothetical protein
MRESCPDLATMKKNPVSEQAENRQSKEWLLR